MLLARSGDKKWFRLGCTKLDGAMLEIFWFQISVIIYGHQPLLLCLTFSVTVLREKEIVWNVYLVLSEWI